MTIGTEGYNPRIKCHLQERSGTTLVAVASNCDFKNIENFLTNWPTRSIWRLEMKNHNYDNYDRQNRQLDRYKN